MFLGSDEIGLADQRRMRGLAGDDPPVGQVPPVYALMPQAHIRRVGQVAIGPLPVPYLTTCVPRVGQDRGDRAQRPPRTCPWPGGHGYAYAMAYA